MQWGECCCSKWLGLIKAARFRFRVNIAAPRAKSAGQCKQTNKKRSCCCCCCCCSSTPATCVVAAKSPKWRHEPKAKSPEQLQHQKHQQQQQCRPSFVRPSCIIAMATARLTREGLQVASCKSQVASCPLPRAKWRPLSADSWEIRTVFVFQITCTCCSSPRQLLLQVVLVDSCKLQVLLLLMLMLLLC